MIMWYDYDAVDINASVGKDSILHLIGEYGGHTLTNNGRWLREFAVYSDYIIVN